MNMMCCMLDSIIDKLFVGIIFVFSLMFIYLMKITDK